MAVRTNRPAPMMAPMPSATRFHEPSVFLSACPSSSVSPTSEASDLRFHRFDMRSPLRARQAALADAVSEVDDEADREPRDEADPGQFRQRQHQADAADDR